MIINYSLFKTIQSLSLFVDENKFFNNQSSLIPAWTLKISEKRIQR
jgi:hypothetical protein